MRAIAIIALATAIGGCRETRGVRWEIATGDPAVRARTAIVIAEVRRGSCLEDGEPLYREEIALGSTAPAVPVLGGGAHAFRAIARDSACIEIARGCQEIVLPGEPDQVVRVELVEIDATGPVCDRCAEGRCDADAGL